MLRDRRQRSRSILLGQDMTRRGQYGHIINISSMSGHRVPNGAGGGSFYAATKHALRALTEGLRQEVPACPLLPYPKTLNSRYQTGVAVNHPAPV